MKSFVLAQDCWRWTLVDKLGEDDETQLAASDGCYSLREAAMEDMEKAAVDHPDADLAVERNIVERVRRAMPGAPAGGESAEDAYKRGYADAKREVMEKLMGESS